MMKKIVTPETLRAAEDARRDRLADYTNRQPSPEDFARMEQGHQEWVKREAAAKERAPRVEPMVQALQAFKVTGDLSLLARLWSAPDRPVLSEADWEAIQGTGR